MTDSERLRRRIGLCVTCEHHRVTGNRRGSRFYLCERASTDHRYRRYPPLPVLRCAGFQECEPDAWAEYHGEEPTPGG